MAKNKKRKDKVKITNLIISPINPITVITNYIFMVLDGEN